MCEIPVYILYYIICEKYLDIILGVPFTHFWCALQILCWVCPSLTFGVPFTHFFTHFFLVFTCVRRALRFRRFDHIICVLQCFIFIFLNNTIQGVTLPQI